MIWRDSLFVCFALREGRSCGVLMVASDSGIALHRRAMRLSIGLLLRGDYGRTVDLRLELSREIQLGTELHDEFRVDLYLSLSFPMTRFYATRLAKI